MQHLKKIVLTLLAIFFPWIVMLIEDKPGTAVITLILQVTLFGWPFATIWALGVIRDSLEANKRKAKSGAV